MSTLMYWDHASAAWEPVAGMHTPQPYLSESGGTMTGPLTIMGTLTVYGKLHAKVYVGEPGADAYYTGNIAMRGRTADLGKSYVSGIGWPLKSDDLASFSYLHEVADKPQARAVLLPTGYWEHYDDDGYGPLSAAQAADGLVSLSGAVKVKTSIAAGGQGSIISNPMPSDMQPVSRRLFFAAGKNPNNMHRVDVLPTGELQYVSGQPVIRDGYWLSFNDICYYPS